MGASKNNWIDKVRGMSLGDVRTLRMNHPRELSSCRMSLYQYAWRNPELGYRFSVSANRARNEITIKAVSLG